MRVGKRATWATLAVLALLMTVLVPAVSAHPDQGAADDGTLHRHDPSEALAAHDAATAEIVSSGPSAKVNKNFDLVGRGDRLLLDATTDVWAHAGFAYTGTFNSPCGGDPEAGVWVWNVQNRTKPSFVGVIQSEPGDRTNDVKASSMNSGDILVMSNEACGASGDGGFEIYDVDDPTSPAKLASVTIDEINPISNALFGGIFDVGVHNLWLFTQGDKDYVAAVAGTAFDTFQIFDITDPTNPTRVAAWGAEEVFDPGVGDEVVNVGRVLNAVFWLLGFPGFDGFGASQNRFLHDITINEEGSLAYLSNWDAGLILLDLADVTDPQLVSVALEPVAGSLDGEVNSHAAWPSEDGSIVVESEEDFSVFEGESPPGNLTMDSSFPGDPTIPGTAISTTAGDDFEFVSQTGNPGSTDGTSVVVTGGLLAGNTYPAIELATAAGSPTFASTGTVSGDLVFIGRGCTTTTTDTVLNAAAVSGNIAVVRRGACFFEEKAAAAAGAGALAVVIANNQQNSVWSGLRIWDYSDPEEPVLASTFNTVCSADPFDPSCDLAGTYSVHNVVVESRGNKTFAYVAWYWDGMLVLDVTDPYNPVEVARYFDNTADFLAANGGNPHDFWGVYKENNSPYIYASDRSAGLKIFQEKGAGKGGGQKKKP